MTVKACENDHCDRPARISSQPLPPAKVHVVEEVVVDAGELHDLRAGAAQLDHVAHLGQRADVVVVDAAVLAGAGDLHPVDLTALLAQDAEARDAAVVGVLHLHEAALWKLMPSTTT
jgi:hypothetical protein